MTMPFMNSDFAFNLLVFVGSFVPTYIGAMRGHRQERTIFALNAVSVVLGLGFPLFPFMLRFDPFPMWGLLGWAATLLWSLSGRTMAPLELPGLKEEEFR